MRSLKHLPGMISRLLIPVAAAIAGIVAVSTAAQAQFRTNNFSVGPRAPMMSPSFRTEPRFQTFEHSDDDVAASDKNKTRGKGKGRIGDSRTDPNRSHAGAGLVTQPGGITIPPPGESRLSRDELLLEFAQNVPRPRITQLLARHRLIQLEAQTFSLTNTTFVRARIANGRAVRIALRGLGNEAALLSGQAIYVFRTSQSPDTTLAPAPAMAAAHPTAGDPAQYVLGRLHLNEAHALATGDKVLVAVIDSRVDASHPELKGAVAESFDALGKPEKPHMHGTAVAGAIVAHARLMGAAPAAKIMAIHAFGASGNSAEATTFAILKGLEYAAVNHARIVNMSFAGPPDPVLARALSAAKGRGMVLVAAAGNFGPKSPPQFPASNPNVIAVSATDASDHLFRASNIGSHIAVAAPGVDLLLPVPDNNYEMISGTSFSAAYVSGVVALLIQRAPALTPDAVRHILETTAKDLGPRGKDAEFGAGLVDAYGAVMAVQANAVAAEPQAAAAPKSGAGQAQPQ